MTIYDSNGIQKHAPDLSRRDCFASQQGSNHGIQQKKPTELLGSLESSVRFSARLAAGVQSRAARWTSEIRAVGGATFDVREYLPATTGDLRELLGALGEIRTDRERISQALKIEFQGYRDLMASPRLLEQLPKNELFLSHFFHPNATTRLFGEAIRGYIDEGERTGRITQVPDYPEPVGVWDSLSKGNVIGRTLATTVTFRPELPFERGGSVAARVRVTQVMVALVIFEEAYGRLPNKLDELVPEILESIPQDPFADQQLKYDRGRRVVWSVGYDGIDDGGQDTSGRGDAVDMAIEIPKRGTE